MIVPFAMIFVFVAVGFNNYAKAKNEMQQDLNNALRQYVMDQSQRPLLASSASSLHEDMVITINGRDNHFNDRLTIHALRDTSHVSLCILRQGSQEPFRERASVCSDTLLLNTSLGNSGESILALKAFANPSFCSVLGHSNQRVPLTGILLSLLLLSAMTMKKRIEKAVVSTSAASFTINHEEMRLTPMQEQLLRLFVAAPDRTLTKEVICSALWPKKDHPEDTLYTFISRMKVSLKKQSDYDIVNIRGKEYRLVDKVQSSDNQECKQNVRQL